MKLCKIRARFRREERQTGRHRSEPKHHLGPLIVIGTAISLLGTAIVTTFIVQGNPAPVISVQPSYNPTPAPHVFPPVRQQPSPAPSTYTVVAGDTMWSVAYRKCGNGLAWKKLQAANSNDPWWIHPGQKLTISC